MNASEAFEDLGGTAPDRWWCLTFPCDECGMAVGVKCWNSISNTVKHSPCISRGRVTEQPGEP